MATTAYCGWCGAQLVKGQRYCGSCGRQVDPSNVAADDDNQSSSSLLGTVGTVLAGIVMVPLTIIMALVGMVLPILIVVALFMGPGDTFDMIKAWVPGVGGATEVAGCEGFDEWMQASNERGEEVLALIEPVMKREVEAPNELRNISNELRDISRDQDQSNPPEEAEVLNKQFTQVFQLLAQMTAAVADRDYAEYQDLEQQYQALSSEVDGEDKRLRQACL